MITKSNFLLYLEAPMHLWAEKHNRMEKVVPTPFELHLMEQGKKIEELGRDFLQGFISSKIINPKLIKQMTFDDGRFIVRSDIVVFDPEEQVYDIYEIKSSTSVKKEHKFDTSFQLLVSEANIPVRNVFIVHLNKDYVRNGEIDNKQLFVIVNVTEEAEKLRSEVLVDREDAWRVATSVSPEGVLGCLKPNDCPCLKLCHPDLPKYPIYNLSRLNKDKARDLINQGILSIMDIPEGYPLSKRQERQLEVVKSGEPLINIAAVKGELSKLEYPLYFLDYETYNPGIPEYNGYKPYQHMVFQYSLHVAGGPDSDLNHFELLVTDKGDPGRMVVEHLSRHIGQTGSVIVWHKGFEASRNEEMAVLYPDYREFLLDINDRIFDLMEVFSKGYYIHPDFHGSASLKNILPVLVEDFDQRYEKLGIQKGDEAMMAWVGIMKGTFPQEQIEKTKEELIRYCALDTMAMVKCWEALEYLILKRR